jgi:hypothetical protein
MYVCNVCMHARMYVCNVCMYVCMCGKYDGTHKASIGQRFT